ncbi:MAG: tRNA (adenosine(37)-N6)-threonylcarbamoyltransferase complex ATPase subunit type 1 TsaE [Planctomycetota bacterium]|nr:tRNA (adenosine(37)-N6)-threonylcarbamoyltransferase complex ATPase subunit type 1 TsaE [Planctomycetota bacterium]
MNEAEWRAGFVIETHGSAETEALGRCCGELAPLGFAVTLKGDLGAGKTVFVRGLAQGLLAPGEAEVSSPTYVLQHVHRGGLATLYHIDAYRIEGGAGEFEASGLGSAWTTRGASSASNGRSGSRNCFRRTGCTWRSNTAEATRGWCTCSLRECARGGSSTPWPRESVPGGSCASSWASRSRRACPMNTRRRCRRFAAIRLKSGDLEWKAPPGVGLLTLVADGLDGKIEKRWSRVGNWTKPVP